MPETTQTWIVGIDVSKPNLDCAIDDDRTVREANTVDGVSRLIEMLHAMDKPVRIVVESTGAYHRLVAESALAAGLEVCVVQPGRARSFALAEGTLGKTDKIDAQMLRRYGRSVELPLMQASDAQSEILRDLLESRRDVVSRLVDVRNQLESARTTKTKWLKRQERFLEKEEGELDKAIDEHIAKNKSLQDKVVRLRELNGVGNVVATTLLAYVPELGTLPGNTIAALVGVAPYPDDSGNHRGLRTIRGGRPEVRHVLYMAAVTAARTNPILSAIYRRMIAAGKKPKVCLVALMRRMLLVLNRLLADPQFCLAR